MDGQQIVGRIRETIGNRLGELLETIERDREQLGPSTEPTHFRRLLHAAVTAGGTTDEGGATTEVSELPFAWAAGEPEPQQQRESLGCLLDAATAALECMIRAEAPDLTSAQALGLECVWLLYVRPVLPINRRGGMADVSAYWKAIEEQRTQIERVQRSVGQIELLGHPEYDWAGTGFLVGEHSLLTTRQTAEVFAEEHGGSWQFRPGISAWIDFQGENHVQTAAACRVLSIKAVHPRYDLAVLEIESPPEAPASPIVPLTCVACPPQSLEGHPVYMVGYPIRDSRRSESEQIARAFRNCYRVKAVQPGQLRAQFWFREIELLKHDCAMLGRSRGSCVVDLGTHRVLGMHLSGRYLEDGTAIPLWALRDDPLLKDAGLNFVEPTPPEQLDRAVEQLKNLFGTSFWPEASQAMDDLQRRAFGGNG